MFPVYFNRSEPLPIPGSEPDATPLLCLPFNQDWYPVIAGLLEQALEASYWDSDTGNVEWAATSISRLIEAIKECGDMDVIHVQHRVPSGVNGGGVLAATWNTHPLTHVRYGGSFVTLSNNRLQFESGLYVTAIQAVTWYTHQSRLRLRDVTYSVTYLLGQNRYAAATPDPAGEQALSLWGIFTPDPSAWYEIQQYAALAEPTYGYGLAHSTGLEEIYLDAIFLKVP